MNGKECHDIRGGAPRWNAVSIEGFVYCAIGRLVLHKESKEDGARFEVASENGDIIILGNWDTGNLENNACNDLATKGVKCFFR